MTAPSGLTVLGVPLENGPLRDHVLRAASERGAPPQEILLELATQGLRCARQHEAPGPAHRRTA